MSHSIGIDTGRPTAGLDETHDPRLRSFIAAANEAGTDFPIQNLPFAVYRQAGTSQAFRVGVAIGDRILDVHAVRDHLDQSAAQAAQACGESSMAALMSLGRPHWTALRTGLSRLLREGSPHEAAVTRALTDTERAEFTVPAPIPNFSDCLASIHHISRMVRLKRPQNPELPPAFVWSPLAYNSRASTVRVSGYEFRRPSGQLGLSEQGVPAFGPTRMLDYEAELGIYVGTPSRQGEPLSVDAADEAVFGLSVLNDWTARDVQGWEAQPLGPFQAKSFTTTISPWVVTLEALRPFRQRWQRASGHPPPPPNLDTSRNSERGGLSVQLEIRLQTAKAREQGQPPALLGSSNLMDCYWSIGQLVAHHTTNGCALERGELIGTGTVSGPESGQCGCMYELTAGGKAPVELPTGERRGFVGDGDSLSVSAFCEAAGFRRIGFGVAKATVLPGR